MFGPDQSGVHSTIIEIMASHHSKSKGLDEKHAYGVTLTVPLPKHVKEVAVKIGDRHCRIKSDDNYLDHIRGSFEPHMKYY